tara:strand:- start:207 stop:617 length:411 start_codon:yes stop_codon:yes gene_type:complete
MQTPEYKIIFVGPSGIGKTTFLCKLSNNIPQNLNNVPKTLGVEVKTVDLHNQNNKIRLNIWDCAGDKSYKGLGKSYYIGSKMAVIFKDQSNIQNIINDIRDMCGEIPILELNNFNKYNDYTITKEIIKNFAFNSIS